LPYLYKELITVRVLLWTVSFDVLQLCLLSWMQWAVSHSACLFGFCFCSGIQHSMADSGTSCRRFHMESLVRVHKVTISRERIFQKRSICEFLL
jgi:hypothetical protein